MLRLYKNIDTKYYNNCSALQFIGESPNKKVFNVFYDIGAHHRCEKNMKKKKENNMKQRFLYYNILTTIVMNTMVTTLKYNKLCCITQNELLFLLFLFD